MEYIKLQVGCILVIMYIGFVYIKEKIRLRQQTGSMFFNALLIVGFLTVIFDGITAYTVNHLDDVDSTFNMIVHMFFLIGLDASIFLLFMYILSTTSGLPKRKNRLYMLMLPFVVNILLVVVNISTLEYRTGQITNYSMGVSAYTCFIMAGIYMALSIIIFLKRWNYIERNKRWSVFPYLLIMAGICIFQMIYPQSLLTSLGVMVIILGIYMNQETPSVTELTNYHEEMVMGFATLVENKDGSTGGHIKRTSAYVKLLIKELQRRGLYKDILNKDYTNNIYKAAPMHDIGKIAIPDYILQKPGKLTDEEFEIMKQHASKGGEIIEKTFGHLGNVGYSKMAYDVARYHHEKWNGRGYPEGLKENEIPLCARIMAIADVFDAVSEKRCYRDAMPLDKCFAIIEEGRGRDFDPLLVDCFLSIRDKVEKVHRETIAS